MKTLQNKITGIDKGNGTFMKYSELAESCLNHTPKDGFNVSEMKSRLDVMGKIDHEKDEIKLEDAEVLKLSGCVSVMPWAIMHKEIVEFSDAVAKMK